MAILFPLLFLILAGIVDFGRYFFTEIQLTNAAREGARVAVVSPDANIRDRVEKAFFGELDPDDTLDVGVTACSGAGTDARVVVAPHKDFEWILLAPAMSIFGASGALPTATSTAVMRCGG